MYLNGGLGQQSLETKRISLLFSIYTLNTLQSAQVCTLLYFIFLHFPGENGGVPNGPHVSIVLQQ